MKIQALYETVTQRIINELEAGTIPWTKPWKNVRVGGILPQNAITAHAYRGANIVILWAERHEKQYRTPFWLTFQQARERGGNVRKGEKGTAIVFTKKLTIKEEDEDKQIQMLKCYYVFNLDQVDGIELPAITHKPHEPHAFVKATGANIEIGPQAMYVPSKDFIAMPPKNAFISEAHYHAVTLHECVHWAGAENRLNRDLKGRYGSQAYAFEELVAEWGSSFLCAHLGIEGHLRHADYIANWLQLLKSDDRALFRAASKAQQAADFLRAFSEETTDACES